MNVPRANDKTMVERFHQSFGGHESYIKPRSNDPIFTIRHYAGDVQYTADGFLEKNRDTLALDVLAALRLRYQLILMSSSRLILTLCPARTSLCASCLKVTPKTPRQPREGVASALAAAMRARAFACQ